VISYLERTKIILDASAILAVALSRDYQKQSLMTRRNKAKFPICP